MVVLLDQKQPPSPAPDEVPHSAKLDDNSPQCSIEHRRRRFRRFSLYCLMVGAFMLLYRTFDFGGPIGKNLDHYGPWHMEDDHHHHRHPPGEKLPKEDRFEKLFMYVVVSLLCSRGLLTAS